MSNFLTHNVRGLKSDIKQSLLANYLRRLRTDIVFLQETYVHNITVNNPTSYMNDFSFAVNPPSPHNACSGTIIGSKKYHFDSNEVIVPGYLQVVRIQIVKFEYHLINVYLPHNNALAFDVLEKLRIYLSRVPITQHIVLAGDWNLTLDAKDRAVSTEHRHDLAQRLRYILLTEDLIDVWRENYPEDLEYTYVGTHVSRPRSRLDRIYIRNTDKTLALSPKITPSFSDHSSLSFRLCVPKVNGYRPYWRFNNLLLEDKVYIAHITNLITHYTRNHQHEHILETWDQMKTEIRVTTQRYESHCRNIKSETLQRTENRLKHLLSQTYLSDDECMEINECLAKIKKKHHVEARTTLAQETSRNLLEMNDMTPSFYQLNRERKIPAQIAALRIDGNIVTEPLEIQNTIRNHFKNLYSPKHQNNINNPELFANLNSLPQTQCDKLNSDLTPNEFETALLQMTKNKSPGLDGLTVEFYCSFWNTIQPLFFLMANTAFLLNSLPRSMQFSVLSLIPKLGDKLILKNWRPISLLNTDYKIISRALTNRLTKALPYIIDSDQTFCIEGRSIYSNLHLMRDTIEYTNDRNTQLAIITLDQEAAFDRIEHDYLIKTMRTFGLGNKFINYITTMYKSARCVIRLGSSLVPPFEFLCGIRQGDPLSGCLFSISIEPFLAIV